MVRERIQIDRIVSEIVSHSLHRDTRIPMDRARYFRPTGPESAP